MTKIEEEFYKTFDIKPFIYCSKPRLDCPARKVDTCTKECEYYSGILYPDITDKILLELICILNDFEGISVKATTIEELKEELLKQCIEPFEYPIAFEEHYEIDKLYNQIKSLFEGEGEE